LKDLDFLKQNLIAHRGYHNISLGIPENSLSAFQKAIDYNYIIELDVHLLKDNTIVVFHDDNLKRMTGIDKLVKNCSYSELQELYLQETQEKIPTLSEVLLLINSQVPIIIELKSDNKVGLLEKELMKILQNYKGKFAIKSFNPKTVFYFKKHYPYIVRGQLSHSYKNSNINFILKYLLKNMVFNIITKPDFISYGINNFPINRIKKLKTKKLVLGWTIRNKEQFEKNYQYFDNLICENMEKYII